jgi:methyl-accepting chemotaxis protein
MNDEQSLRSRLEFIGIDTATRATLRELRPLVAKVLPSILDGFYTHIAKFPRLAGLFRDDATIRRAKQAQIEHWTGIMAGTFDDAYLKSVRHIGATHQRLGIEPRWYIAGYSMIITGLLRAIETENSAGWFSGHAAQEKKATMLTAITRAAMLDMDLSISVYLDAARQEHQAAVIKITDGFEAVVGEIIGAVSSASAKLENSAGTLTKTAEKTQLLSAAVAATSQQVSSNVQSVASSTEEMTNSVHEIGRQVSQSTAIAEEAVRQAEQTDAGISELSRTAERIGDVLKLITSIAEQTNLLALNATIEAARAGDAGRGFAVVASEVKALASQTAKATEDISQQIAGIQTATHASVAAIKQISGTIRQISNIAAGIAGSVEAQGSATREISRNVQEVASSTSKVTSNITEVNRGAGETGSASSQVLASAKSLSTESNRLKLEVDKFLKSVRAA